MFDDDALSKREIELLELAYKNSLMETQTLKEELREVPSIPVFCPTEDEFKDPVAYIESIFSIDEVRNAGGFKIRPPKSFRPPCTFNPPSEKRIPT